MERDGAAAAMPPETERVGKIPGFVPLAFSLLLVPPSAEPPQKRARGLGKCSSPKSTRAEVGRQWIQEHSPMTRTG